MIAIIADINTNTCFIKKIKITQKVSRISIGIQEQACFSLKRATFLLFLVIQVLMCASFFRGFAQMKQR